MKIYFYTWSTFWWEHDWDNDMMEEGHRIETFTTPEASLNAYEKHKRKIDKLNSLGDEKIKKGDLSTRQYWSITEPVGLEVKGYQDLKKLCEHFVNKGDMNYEI